jgi:curved DNA-binding protein CbpA
MTLQGALRLLQLPADPGHRVTLAQIREAYRVMALSLHPDAGGSAEAMRRLGPDAARVQVLFVTIDPQRDVPRQYLPDYNATFEQIKILVQAAKNAGCTF